MVQQDYRVVISETYKKSERRFSTVSTEKEKTEKKQKTKWLNLLFKINKALKD